jgi:hypothetical protein
MLPRREDRLGKNGALAIQQRTSESALLSLSLASLDRQIRRCHFFGRLREVAKIAKIAKIAKNSGRPFDTASHQSRR